MQQVHIVTDSTCHIPESLCHELDITVVNLPYAWDGKTYLDGVDMGPREFFSKLRSSDTLPTTSAPTPSSFKEAFEKVLMHGGPILVIHVGQEFSSTYRTAELAKEMFPDKPIYLFDSHSNALGHGFQVLAAARAAREGASISEVLGIVEKARLQTGVIFALKDISYMRRGGRISLGQSFFSAMLDLVPIMKIENGPIELVERVRTSKRAISRIIDQIIELTRGKSPVRIGILHADNEAEAYKLRKLIEQEIKPDELLIKEVNPTLGIHIGPGAFGIAYCTEI